MAYSHRQQAVPGTLLIACTEPAAHCVHAIITRRFQQDDVLLGKKKGILSE